MDLLEVNAAFRSLRAMLLAGGIPLIVFRIANYRFCIKLL